MVGNIPNYEKISGKVHAIYQNKGTSIWILDSGASDHIVCDFSLLTTSKPSHNHFVKLPNETKLKVSHIGTVTFTSDFILQNVLCVPDFYLNLISISKLTFDSFYITIFLRKICFVQDLQSGKTIGTGIEDEGLYYLRFSKEGTCNVVNSPSPDLWHQRLGHPSSKVSSLFSFPANKSCNASTCSICPLAKFTSQSFPLSNTTNPSCFELIHVDIWGVGVSCSYILWGKILPHYYQ